MIIAEKPAAEFGAWNERSDDDLLADLALVQAAVSQADAAVHDYVDVLRGRGISWTRIAEALGVSKQAAWERFSGEDWPPGSPTPRSSAALWGGAVHRRELRLPGCSP